MFSELLVLSAVLGVAWTANTLYKLSKNIQTAKGSGLVYRVAPFRPYPVLVLLLLAPLRKLLRLFLPAWDDKFGKFAFPMSHNRLSHQFFQDLGSDTFLMVSPDLITLYTCEAPVVAQICQRRRDFPKPLGQYKLIDVFGKNVVSSEGDRWRLHRKIVAPSFSEKNNSLVWSESISLAQHMLKDWTEDDQPQWAAVNDTMRLSLSVIARAGFGQRFAWPGSDDESKLSSASVWPGHEMSFKDAIATLLHSLLPIILFGKYLAYIPFQWARDANKSWREWNFYMRDMIKGKREDIANGVPNYDQDLLGALSLAANGDEKESRTLLSDAEILGNAFVVMLAGHETTSNSIFFSLIYLAMYPNVQRQVQADVARIFDGRAPDAWSYEHDMPKLYNSMVGAVLLEQLRCIPPVTDIPKSTASPQPLIVNGTRCVVPADVEISLRTPALHRNPKHWPHDNIADLDEFRPSRWLTTSMPAPARGPTAAASSADDAEYANPDAAPSSALFRPVEGAFIPFSEGARSCIGKRFAQVEVVAVLAVILAQYTVELALDDFAPLAELRAMAMDVRRQTWARARKHADVVLRERLVSRITTQMATGERVPLRFVRKGEEMVTFE